MYAIRSYYGVRMKWIIDKQFDFCYGHRVWSQSLEVDYSLDDCLMCRSYNFV